MKATTMDDALLNPLTWKIVTPADFFNPAQKFKEKANIDGVSIAHVNESFEKNYLRKTETNIKQGNLQICQLNPKTTANDAVIIYELMARKSSALDLSFAVALCHIWELLKAQPDGQDGKLTTADGEKNIFFSPNASGILMPIQIYWKEEENEKKRLLDSGWIIESYPETTPFKSIIGQDLVPTYNRMRNKNDRIFYFQAA